MLVKADAADMASRDVASAHVVVLGNEKGGSGKSTTAMHVAVALMKAGQRVATIDLDSRQKSFTHYIEHRRAWAQRAKLDLELPVHFCVARGEGAKIDENEAAEFAGFADAITEVEHTHDFIVIDTPGSRHLPQSARPFDGRYADHSAQRQFPRFRRARDGRSADLRPHRHQPLLGDGARGAPPAPHRRRARHRLGGGAQSAVDARLAQQAAGGGGARTNSPSGSASASSTGLPSVWSIASSFRAG